MLTVVLFSVPLRNVSAFSCISPLELILPSGDLFESMERHLEATYLNGMLLV